MLLLLYYLLVNIQPILRNFIYWPFCKCCTQHLTSRSFEFYNRQILFIICSDESSCLIIVLCITTLYLYIPILHKFSILSFVLPHNFLMVSVFYTIFIHLSSLIFQQPFDDNLWVCLNFGFIIFFHKYHLFLIWTLFLIK